MALDLPIGPIDDVPTYLYLTRFSHHITAGLTWSDIEWMKSECSKYGMALLVKGIMTAEDTARACQAGVDGVIVSNHGAVLLRLFPICLCNICARQSMFQNYTRATVVCS